MNIPKEYEGNDAMIIYQMKNGICSFQYIFTYKEKVAEMLSYIKG
ncbi:unnamed protein product, partial [marine sediment metagenome]